MYAYSVYLCLCLCTCFVCVFFTRTTLTCAFIRVCVRIGARSRLKTHAYRIFACSRVKLYTCTVYILGY